MARKQYKTQFENDVKCQMCGYVDRMTLQYHIKKEHSEITVLEYKEKYDTEITSKRLKTERAKSSSFKRGAMSEEDKKLRSEKNKSFWNVNGDMKEVVAERMKEAGKNGTHPSQTKEVREKARQNAIKRNKTDKQKQAVKDALVGIKRSVASVEKSAEGHRGIPLSKEHKAKLSVIHKKAIAEGTRKMPGKFIGKYWSEKNNKYIHYRSKLELIYMEKLEEDITVVEYKTDYPRIPYEVDFEKHTYLPDFLINGIDLVEINSYNVFYLNKKKKEAKAKAAREYCKENGLTYKIIYEDDLGVKYNVPDYIKNYNFPKG